MLRDEQGLEAPRHVHFANGFPPKGIVSGAPRIVPNSSSANMHGGYLVGLQDKVSGPPSLSQRQHKNIPPLAKGRGQFCAIKRRRQDDVQPKPNPYKAKKGAEKVGFSPQPIKYACTKHSRSAHQMGSQKVSPTPPSAVRNVSVYHKKPLHVAAIYPNPARNMFVTEKPDRDTNSAASGTAKNVKILSDVEKVTTQEELSGIGEVYKRICHGNLETLSTLVTASKTQAKKKPGLQFIQTTAPLSLGKQLSVNRKKRREDVTNVGVMRSRSLDDGRELKNQALDNNINENIVESIQSKYRSILVPLPYFKSGSTCLVSTVSRQSKAVHEPPIIYSNKKQNSRTASSNIQSPSVVNISAANLPGGLPGTRNGNCSPTGEIVGVQNRASTGTVAIVAAIPQMRSFSPQTPNTRQTSALTTDTDSVIGLFEKQKSQDFETNANGEIDNPETGKMEIESIDDVVSERSSSGRSFMSVRNDEDGVIHSGMEHGVENQFKENSLGSRPQSENNEQKSSDVIEIEENTENKLSVAPGVEDDGDANGSSSVTARLRKMSLGIVLNLTTEDGEDEGVEVFDASSSDPGRKKVASELEAIARTRQQRKKEVEDLLNEVSEIGKQIEESETS